MTRVKRGVSAHRKREKLLKQTKGYRWGRKSKERAARQANMKAMTYAYRDRKNKKRDMRRLWQIKINAGARVNNTTYSSLIHALKLKGVGLDRKILADLAENEPKTFAQVVLHVGPSQRASDEVDAPSSVAPDVTQESDEASE